MRMVVALSIVFVMGGGGKGEEEPQQTESGEKFQWEEELNTNPGRYCLEQGPGCCQNASAHKTGDPL